MAVEVEVKERKKEAKECGGMGGVECSRGGDGKDLLSNVP